MAEAASTSSSDVSAMSVTQLKDEIARLGAQGKMFSGMEKSDLVALVLEARAAKPAAAAAPAAGNLTELCNSVYPGAAARAAKLRYGRVAYVGNTTNPTAIVVITHGLGDTCEGWAQAMEFEIAPAMKHVLFVAPTAATQPVTMNMRMPCPAWYDIRGLGPRSEEDPEGVAISCGYLEGVVAAAAARHGIPWSRVALAGFSQGGALSLCCGLLLSERPACVAVLSGYLAARDYLIPRIRNKDVPIFQAHGTADPMVGLALAQQSRQMLEQHGVANIESKTYPGMQHSTCAQEMADLTAFLLKHLPAK